MKKLRSLYGICFAIALLASCSFSVFAQSQTISGSVSDAVTSEPLAGVSIVVVGSETESGVVIGTQTDAMGRFNLDVPAGFTALKFSYIGYISKEQTIQGQTMNVVLEPDVLLLEEAVVVGFGTQKRANLSGAVDEVDMEALELRSISNVTQGLQGLIPNLNIDYTAGAPGTEPIINIRGYTSINGGSPLILIDGIPAEARDLNLLDAQDVSSISVLKDASSAAIYGARAAFGVLLIETKRGGGEQMNVNYTHRTSWDTPTVIPEKVTDPYVYMRWQENSSDATPWDYINYSDDMYAWARDRSDNPSSTDAVRVNPSNTSQWQYMGNRDWSEYFLSDYGMSSNNTLSLSGSTANTNYYLSGSMDNQDGALQIDDDNFERLGIRSNVEYRLNQFFNITNLTQMTQSSRNAPSYLSGESSSMQSFYLLAPTSWHKNPDGTWANSAAGQLAAQLTEGGDFVDEYNKFQTTFTLRSDIIPSLLSLNADYTFRSEKRNYDWDYKKYRIGYGPNDVRELGNTAVYRYRMDYDYQVLNLYASLNKQFQNHQFSGIIGYNQESYDFYRVNTSITDVISSSLPSISLALGSTNTSDSYTGWAVQGVFGRLNYIFKDKYIVEFNGRYDGSSRFPENDRFGFFPSASLGWRLDQESFFNVDAINVFKLRASYGTLGNQSVSDFGYIPSMSTYNNGYLVDNNRPLSISAPGMVSSNYTWEEVTSQNIGLDIELLESKLQFNLDLYTRDTEGMLTLGKELPSVLGTSEPNENAADLRTKGWEVAVNYRDNVNFLNDRLSFGARLTLADAQSEITSFDNPNQNLNQYYVGAQIGEIWGLTVDGFFESEEEITNSPDQSSMVPWGAIPTTVGSIKFADINGDGVITKGTTVADPGDMKVIGNSEARYRFGINLDFNYKGFDVQTFFQGIGKRDYYPFHYVFWGFHQQPYNGGFTHLLDYYRAADDSPEAMSQHSQKYIDMGLANANTDSRYPVLQAWNMDVNTYGAGSTPNDKYLLDASYLRWKNLTIGYRLPGEIIQSLGLSQVRVYLSGENLMEWSEISDIVDPEAVTNNGRGYVYPFQRRYSLGINVQF
ncbi:MAG: SusC/RagA family TonB-linked outer membrane protein [Rhodothermaeota bacterium MED-G12]|nr:MAG: SusC/RagA family TonB-linked outer membrane protein [Rhodothermaeota bacterium MED-G12]|tara:strand:- start:3300 stop:6530 length:3231 start_codon:yes stop_codon:yes gene_type:complete